MENIVLDGGCEIVYIWCVMCTIRDRGWRIAYSRWQSTLDGVLFVLD